MSDKKDILKYILLFSTIIFLVIILSIFVIIYRIIHVDNSYDNKGDYSFRIEYESSKYNAIEFSFINAAVSINETPDSKLVLEQFSKNDKLYYKGSIKNKILKIEETNEGALFTSVVNIYIPTGDLKKVKINNAFGNIKINDISYPLNIKNNSGNIIINKDSNVLEIDNVSGKIDIKDLNGDLYLTTSTGDIVINNIVGYMKIDSISGNVIANNFLIKKDSEIDSVTGDISVIMNTESTCRLRVINESGSNNINKEICNSTENILKVVNVTGDIIIE